MRFVYIFLMVSLIMVQAIIRFSDHGQKKLDQLKQELDNETQQKQALLVRNGAMQADIDDLAKGGQALEEKIRRERNVIGKDEVFIQFIE